MSTPADCNLLLGVLALQLDFVTREQLVAVVTGWLREKETPLGQLLEQQKVLTAARRQLLEALVVEHLRQHGGDVEQSLATLSSLGPVRDELQRLGDAELSISLSRVAGGAAAARGDAALSDLPATSSFSNPGPSTETAAEDSTPPRLRFRILRPHAEGGLGRVLVAHDEELHREVALKEIKPQFAMDVDCRNRFTLEAEVTGGLEHPGIVPVYGLGQYSDGRPYYAMRFIRGDSLKEAIEQFHAAPRAQIASLETAPDNVNDPTLIGTKPTIGAVSSTEPAPRLVSSETFAAVEFRKLLGRFIDVCQAIEYAHSRGVLHRDLKPSNIMLGKYGETLVVDWGLAKVAGKDDRFANVDEVTLMPSSGSSIENTADGSVIGTPAYMSPEQAAGRLEQLGPATDVYSLGATLYHVLTGRSPFSKLPLPELLKRVQAGEFPRPREINSQIPKSLEAVCLRAMAVQPDHRYESAAAIAEDIEHWLADEPVTAHRESPLAKLLRAVRRNRDDVHLRNWSVMLAWFATIVFLAEIAIQCLDRNSGLTPFLITRGVQFTAFAAVAIRFRQNFLSALHPAAVQMWSLCIGFLAACYVDVLARCEQHWLLTPDRPIDPYICYPTFLVLSGFFFVALGRQYWGVFYLIGVAFFALAIMLPWGWDWSPIIFGGVWSGTLGMISWRLRSLQGGTQTVSVEPHLRK